MSTSAVENCGLCWKCQSLLNTQYPGNLVIAETKEPDKKKTRQIKTFDSVEVTASKGCMLCFHLLHALSIPAKAALRQLTSAIDGTPSGIVYEEEIYVSEGSPPSIALRVDPDNLVLGWNSDTSWSVVANWLDECAKSHKSCNVLMAMAPSLPSRIIELGSGAPRLVVVKGDIPILPYATMSHCWGSHMPLRLISSNITELQKQIPMSQLSKSFKDAFLITQRLGLNYIWINSLCIVQDSAADWERESASMSEVYSNSYCTIAAAHAADGTYGCFIERSPDLVKPLKVNLNWGPNPGTYYAVQWLYWRMNVIETPLNRRAWECCGRVASETFPLGLPDRLDGPSKSLDPTIDGARRRKGLGLSEAPDLDAFSLWDLIISNYSKGELTYSTDKLVALSGLAARMQKHTQSQYLAGMWRKHLAYQLLWNSSGIQWVVSTSRPINYTAPSWSWASMYGHIEDACVVRHADDREIVLQILDVRVDIVSDKNPFGQVRGGFLRLLCSLAKTGVYLEESPENRDSFRLIVDGLRLGSARVDDYSHESDPVEHHGFYYLPVRYNARYEEVNQGGVAMSVPRVAGIILQATSPETQSEFVRVGTFTVSASPKDFQSACRQYSRELREVEAGYDLEQWGAKWDVVIL